MADVVLADGDRASGLASMLGTLLAQNVERAPQKLHDFVRVGSDVVFEVTDLGETVTLSFRGDRCTVHNGAVGRPRVRIRTDSTTLMGLSMVRTGPLGLPDYLDEHGRAVVRAMAKGRLRIRGLWHVPTLNRITRLFSVT